MKRVAAYCRVSTDRDDQKNSLQNQREFFLRYISNNSDWEFADIYVDEGLSGTSTKKRKAFNQMISDGLAGLYDIILTKEISRFARNTLDSIYYTRILKAKGIGVLFINDNIDTLDKDSELRLGIMASIAQEESRKTSDRVKWGQRRSMERGVTFGSGVYGYSLANGKLLVNCREADVVRLIFRKYLQEGKDVSVIAKELDAAGIPTPTHVPRWTHATLLRMLKNEKYIGVLKQKKQITTDYLNHSRKQNEGEEDFVVLYENHEPIIDKQVFASVQAEILRRRNHVYDKTKYSNRYPFSGKLVCGLCNARLKRRVNNRKAKNQQIVWECAESLRHGKEKTNAAGNKVGCNSKHVKEDDLQAALLRVFGLFISDRQAMVASIEKSLTWSVCHGDNLSTQTHRLSLSMDNVFAKKKKLTHLYMDGLITQEEFESISNELLLQAQAHAADIAKLSATQKTQQSSKDMIGDMRRCVSSIVYNEEFSTEVCKAVLCKVVVHSQSSAKVFVVGHKHGEFIHIHP